VSATNFHYRAIDVPYLVQTTAEKAQLPRKHLEFITRVPKASEIALRLDDLDEFVPQALGQLGVHSVPLHGDCDGHPKRTYKIPDAAEVFTRAATNCIASRLLSNELLDYQDSPAEK
jgi:hypothetical protein